MPDRESVIIGLRNCKPSWFTVEKCNNDSCPYNRFGHENGGCVDHLIDDVLELLKEQEPVKPIRLENWWKCPYCSGNIVANMNYCPRCGKELKWE